MREEERAKVNTGNYVEEFYCKGEEKNGAVTGERSRIKRGFFIKCWRGCGEREPSYTVGGNVS